MLEHSINIIHGILDHIFQIFNTENAPVEQILPCLAILLFKMKMILPTSSKHHIILWEKLKIIWQKKTDDFGKLHPDFSEQGKEERQLGMWLLSAKN